MTNNKKNQTHRILHIKLFYILKRIIDIKSHNIHLKAHSIVYNTIEISSNKLQSITAFKSKTAMQV